MNAKMFALLLSSFALVACSQQAETSVAADSTASAASQSSAAAPAGTTLTTADGKISLQVAGTFQDQSSNAELLPAGSDKNDIVLLQQDSAADITLYVANLGKPKKDAAQYFGNLKADLQADKGLSNLNIQEASGDTISYSYQAEGVNESCTTLYSADALYQVCAHGTADAAQLSSITQSAQFVAKP
ncbi:MAG: hypothetical protein Q4E16_05200 [Neisseria sp.]|nr:hypothetical protein [Neisseria sp.]